MKGMSADSRIEEAVCDFRQRLSHGEVTPEMFMEGLGLRIESDMNELMGRVIGPNDLWSYAIALALHPGAQVAFRASWALEWACYDDPAAFTPHLPQFLATYLQATNPSVHRHYGKILHRVLKSGAFMPDDAQAEAVAGKAFDLLVDPEVKTASKVWAMEVLWLLSDRAGWIESELYDSLRHIMQTDPSPGVANRGGKLLRCMDGRRAKGVSRTAEAGIPGRRGRSKIGE